MSFKHVHSIAINTKINSDILIFRTFQCPDKSYFYYSILHRTVNSCFVSWIFVMHFLSLNSRSPTILKIKMSYVTGFFKIHRRQPMYHFKRDITIIRSIFIWFTIPDSTHQNAATILRQLCSILQRWVLFFKRNTATSPLNQMTYYIVQSVNYGQWTQKSIYQNINWYLSWPSDRVIYFEYT